MPSGHCGKVTCSWKRLEEPCNEKLEKSQRIADLTQHYNRRCPLLWCRPTALCLACRRLGVTLSLYRALPDAENYERDNVNERQRATRTLLAKLGNSRGKSLCNASVHFPTATTTTAKLISKTITSMSFITIRMPTTPRGNARHASSRRTTTHGAPPRGACPSLGKKAHSLRRRGTCAGP